MAELHPSVAIGAQRSAQRRYEANQKRESEFLVAIRQGRTIKEACDALGWSPHAYRQYRRDKRHHDFAARVDEEMARVSDPEDRSFKGSFADFRQIFLNRSSPWFHRQAIDAMDTAQPGSITLLLWPPEHGKTALWEDRYTHQLCVNPSVRITVGSEKFDHSKKILGFVKDRLENEAPGMERLRAEFGPFAPQPGDTFRQPWTVGYFNVRKKPKGIDSQRDFNMLALGMDGSVIGTRADQLAVDDPQSRKTLNRTEELFETFRDDWLTRPGPHGRTVVLMNVVGENDFSSRLIDSELVDRLIIVRAWDERYGWAWPERYSPRDYKIMERNAGPDGWERKYLQIGVATRSKTFTKRHTTEATNALRSIAHPPPRDEGQQTNIVITLDPGFGVTAIQAGALLRDRYAILDTRWIEGLTGWAPMFQVIEDMLITYNVPGMSAVTDVVIESKAFQRGLLTDAQLVELMFRFQFDVHPHETGGERNDEDIGVPQMASAMVRHEIEIPYSDPASIEMADRLITEFHRWRPTARGNKLRMDGVMATWFGWSLWRRTRRILTADTTGFHSTSIANASQRLNRIAQRASGLYVPRR